MRSLQHRKRAVMLAVLWTVCVSGAALAGQAPDHTVALQVRGDVTSKKVQGDWHSR